MNETAALLFGMYVALGGLLIALGLPMVLGRVPPNRLYGFRTPTTLARPDIWYPVNRVAGWWSVVLGAVTATATAIAWVGGAPPVPAVVVLAVVVGVGVAGMAIHGCVLSGRLKRSNSA